MSAWSDFVDAGVAYLRYANNRLPSVDPTANEVTARDTMRTKFDLLSNTEKVYYRAGGGICMLLNISAAKGGGLGV